MVTSSDTLAVTAGFVAGVSTGQPPTTAILQSLILQVAVNLIKEIPTIIRAIKARRVARKAKKNAL
jgi:hypothetical protein